MKQVEIIGFDGKYLISDNGIVYNKLTGKVIPQHDNGSGYMTVVLNRRKRYVHRLVALHFVPNGGLKPQVNHIDSNKLNNHVSNLEWMTAKENIRHYFKSDLAFDKVCTTGKKHPNIYLGTEHGRHKLTELQVLQIRSNPQGLSQKQMAALYGISQFQVSKIVRRINWTHI